MSEPPRVTRRVRVDFNNLWRGDHESGVIVGEWSNPGLATGDRVIAYDAYDSDMHFDATVARVANSRVFLACEWEAAR